MNNKNIRTLKLGAFVIIGLLIFFVLLYFLGSKKNIFSKSVIVKASFSNIKGVVTGNNVWYNGITIGFVSDINMVSDSLIMLDLNLKKEFTKYIYKNSIAEISQKGLMGSKIVVISKGTPEAGMIKKGDILQEKEGIDIQAMINEASGILIEVRNTSEELKQIVHKINSGQGDIGALINERTLTNKINATTSELLSLSKRANNIAAKIDEGEGDIAKLINEDHITTEANKILGNLQTTGLRADSILTDLSAISSEIKEGDGTMAKLINDENMAMKVDTAIASVDEGVKQIIKTAKAIEDSWILNLFNKKKKKNRKNRKQQPESDSISN